MVKSKILGVAVLLTLLAACGGGGGSSGAQPPVNAPKTPSENEPASPANTISAAELLKTGDDVVEEGADLTLEEAELVLGSQDKLTISGKLTIGES